MFFGLKVNVAKSNVFFSVITKRGKMDLSAPNTSIRRTLTLKKYLGFQMFHGHLQRKDFGFLEDKISQRLASWQHKLFNKAGYLTLVRFVLDSLLYVDGLATSTNL